ncbi:MAG: hypothetical protein R2795_04190 [Saprospiraceae bacterium]
MRFIVVVVLFLHAVTAVMAQKLRCARYDHFFPNTSIEIPILISDYFNNDLSDPMQGFVVWNWDLYTSMWVEITLISPSGQSGDLIGPNGSSTLDFTPFTQWDISFVPCVTLPMPDSAFANQWNNEQAENWIPFETYNGSYHPFNGCLEAFNTGTSTALGFSKSTIIHLITQVPSHGFASSFAIAEGWNAALLTPASSFLLSF